jgi:hypothetical protein
MKCSRIKMPGGGMAIVCGTHERLKQCHCGCLAPFLCDWKKGERTCDAPICPAHAFQAGPDKHLCPWHTEAYRAWLRDVIGIAY